MFVQVLVPQLSVEAFTVGILCPLARLNQQWRDAVFIGPLIESLASKLRSLIRAKHLRISAELGHTVQELSDIIAGQGVCWFDQH